MPTDRLTRDRRELVRTVRLLLDSDACALFPRGQEALRKQLVLAAVAHCCVLLERIDRERTSGDDLVGRVAARAHLESWLHGMYLHLGGVNALREVAAAFRWSLQAHQKALDRLDDEATAEGDKLEVDFSPLLMQFDDVEARQLKIEELARRVHASMSKEEAETDDEVPHPRATVVYDLVYRALSTLGAHPNYWVLEKYITQPRLFRRVGAHAVVTMMEGPMHTALPMTADLAARGFGAFGCDITTLERLVDRYSIVGDDA